MGLDQYLYAKKYTSKNFDEGQFETLKEALGTDIKYLDKQTPSISIQLKVGQWRKSNQIHQYFVNNCQDGEDDCREVYVGREKLAELLGLCKQVLDAPSGAKKVLPTQDGFFFGNTDYNEYYFADLKNTVEILKNALTMDDDWEFSYQSSW